MFIKVILSSIVFFRIFTCSESLSKALNLLDMPKEIYIKILGYFDITDIEYQELKKIGIKNFSGDIITKSQAEKSIFNFYKKSLYRFDSFSVLKKRLDSKYKKLDSRFFHYKILNFYYKKILTSFKLLEFDYNILRKHLKKYFKLKDKFYKFYKILKEYLRFKNDDQFLTNYKLLFLLKSLKKDTRNIIFKIKILNNQEFMITAFLPIAFFSIGALSYLLTTDFSDTIKLYIFFYAGLFIVCYSIIFLTLDIYPNVLRPLIAESLNKIENKIRLLESNF